jgi:hypothetical protein
MKRPLTTPWLSRAAGLMLLSAITGMAPAHAQAVFKCKHPDGSTFFSDRDCGGSEKLSQPQDAARKATGPLSVEQFLSPRCQRLRAALHRRMSAGYDDDGAERTNRSNEYESLCRAEEQDAQERLYQRQHDLREQERQAIRAREEARQRQVREQAQCVELGKIIRARQAQLNSMTPGERSDFERSRTAFMQRCQGG